MQARRDQNITDAWEKGGLFEGRKVTDDAILSYWRGRTKVVAKDDPLYDTYTQAVNHLDYRIHESKMTATYALIKEPSAGDDTNMANFYLNWSKKIPKDSEFYRELQRDAGQYIHAAAYKSKVNADKLKKERYDKEQGSIDANYNAPGVFWTNAIRNMAQTGNRDRMQGAVLGADDPRADMTDAGQGAADLASINDPSGLLNIIDGINSRNRTGATGHGGITGKGAGSQTVLYVDPLTNKPVTGADLVAMASKAIPGFDGVLDLKDIHTMLDKRDQGLARQADLARKNGYATDAARYDQARETNLTMIKATNAWPVEKQYQAIWDADAKVQNDPTSTADDKIASRDKALAKTGLLADDPRIKDDPALQTRFKTEAAGQNSGPTIGEDLSGTSNKGSSAVIDKRNSDYEGWKADSDALKAGTGVMTTGARDAQGVFHAQPGGPELGVADANTLDGAHTVLVQTRGGKFVPVSLVPVDVHVEARDSTGKAIPFTSSNAIPGVKAFASPDGTMVYQVGTDKDGKPTYSQSLPGFDSEGHSLTANGGSISQGSGGIVISFVADTTVGATNSDAQHLRQAATGVTPGGQATATPGITAKVTVDDATGATKTTYAFDAATWYANVDDGRAVNGGINRYTDYTDINTALYSGTPEGDATLRNMRQSSAWAAYVDNEARTQSGYIRGRDGSWEVNPAGGTDPNLYGQITSRMNTEAAAASDYNDAWGTHATRFAKDDRVTPGGSDLNHDGLPDASVAGTSFAAVGDAAQRVALRGGGLGPVPQAGLVNPEQRLMLKTAGQITLPGTGPSTGPAVPKSSGTATGTVYSEPSVPTVPPAGAPGGYVPPKPPPPPPPASHPDNERGR
jgi:hypothetical protein